MWPLYQLHKDVFLSRRTYKNIHGLLEIIDANQIVEVDTQTPKPYDEHIISKALSLIWSWFFPNSFDSSGKLSTRCCNIAVGICSPSDTRASVRSATHAGSQSPLQFINRLVCLCSQSKPCIIFTAHYNIFDICLVVECVEQDFRPMRFSSGHY